MSMQYRPEHGGISLDTGGFPEPSNTSLRPHTCNKGVNQTSGFYIDSIFINHQQQLAYRSRKETNSSPPICAPSPQQSSQCSDVCDPCHQVLDSHYDIDTQGWSDNSDQSCSSHCRVPYNHGHQSSVYDGLSYQSVHPAYECSPRLERSSSPGHANSLQNDHCDSHTSPSMEASVGGSHVAVGQRSVRHILEELESALMAPDEDTELTGYVGGGNGMPPDQDCKPTVDIVFSKSSQHASSYLGKQVPAMSSQFSHPINQRYIEATVSNLQDLRQAAAGCLSHFSDVTFIKPNFGSVNNASPVEQLLVGCAEAISANNFQLADTIMVKLKQAVSIYGDPMERLAAYMAEGLVARLSSSGKGIYNSLKCEKIPAANVLSAMQKMYEICPYFKFGLTAVSGAIAEAFKNEEKVHILDFEILRGTQWIPLIQALANRPGGPPSVRLTGVNDPESESGQAGGLKFVGHILRKTADNVGLPFEFCPLPAKMAEVKASMIELRPDEALAVNFTLQLHHMPDESVSLTNPRDKLLQMVKGMNPKVLTLVEQEANTNTAPFLPRFLETLDYYRAVFDSIDVALPRESKDRVNVEQQCLAREIVNIIACEGAERVERHELMGKWRARLRMAGFRPRPLSSYVNSTIKALLDLYCGNYRLEEEGGALFLGWLNRPLITASAWQ